jgi:hypothetical protein
MRTEIWTQDLPNTKKSYRPDREVHQTTCVLNVYSVSVSRRRFWHYRIWVCPSVSKERFRRFSKFKTTVRCHVHLIFSPNCYGVNVWRKKSIIIHAHGQHNPEVDLNVQFNPWARHNYYFTEYHSEATKTQTNTHTHTQRSHSKGKIFS